MSKNKHSSNHTKDLINRLKQDGWFFCYQKGSHSMFKHPVKSGKISVPIKITKNIELSVLRQAGLRKGVNYQDGHQR